MAVHSKGRRKKPAHSEATESALTYAKKIAGAKHAPRWVRHQCADFVGGYEGKAWPYDDGAVKEAVWFFHGLPVPLGNFTDTGRIELAPPQMYWAAELYGRRHPDDPARRRYKEFYLVVPRKAGKSTFGAAMCLKELCDPNRNGPLAQCAGRTKDMAWHVYDRAKKMVMASKSLRAKYAMTASDRQIKRDDDSGARMVCESGNLKDGSSPVIATFDELHDTENPHPIQVLRSSFAATRDPMLAKFTTAGYLPLSLGLQERELAIQNFRGTISLPSHLNLLYEWDEDLGDALDDEDPLLWEAVHPMYHHTVEPDFYPTMCQKSLVDPDSRREFTHKLLCKWLRGDQSAVITEADWDALPEPPPLMEAAIKKAWIGVDSAELLDLTSLTLLAELEDGRLCAWWRVMAPRVRLVPVESVRGNTAVLVPQAIAGWHQAGWIESCGEKRADFGIVAGAIKQWCRSYPVEVVVVDQFSGNDDIFAALDEPLRRKMIRSKKYAAAYTPPTQELLGRIQDRTLSVERNPVARWAACNAVMDSKVSGSMLPKKVTKDSPHKIDPLDSLLQAIKGKQHMAGGHMKVRKDDPVQIRDIGFGGDILFI